MDRKYLITFLSSAQNPSKEWTSICNSIDELDKELKVLENNSYVYNITIRLIYE